MSGKSSAKGEHAEGRDSGVKSLTKALDLLNFMGKRRHAAGITELAHELGLPKSAIHRLLKTLEASGFVDQNPVTKQYFLGPRLFVLGKVYESTVTLRGMARPVMERLAAQLGEAVHLAVPARAERGIPSMILLDKVESTYRLTMTPYPGAMSQAHCTGAGKVLLAYAMDDALDQVDGELPRYTEHTLTDLAALKAELAAVRARGYAFDNEELEIGLTCVAAPVFEGGHVVASISVSGPTTRITGDRMVQVRQAVLAAARELGELLG